MKPHYKEYNIDEWIRLTPEIRSEIINNYWTPFDSEIGKLTRSNILTEFMKTVDKDFYLCEFGYFGHYLIGIRYVPKNSKKRVSKDFHGILIQKGKIVERVDSYKVKVSWRFSGTEIIEIDKHGIKRPI